MGLGLGLGGGKEIQASAPNPTTLEVPEPSHATERCWHGCPQGKESDEMWGNHVAWRVRARGLHMDQCSTRTEQGRGQITDCCQNKCMFPWITVHLGLQVHGVVWSADPPFPVKQEEPNEWR